MELTSLDSHTDEGIFNSNHIAVLILALSSSVPTLHVCSCHKFSNLTLALLSRLPKGGMKKSKSLREELYLIEDYSILCFFALLIIKEIGYLYLQVRNNSTDFFLEFLIL